MPNNAIYPFGGRFLTTWWIVLLKRDIFRKIKENFKHLSNLQEIVGDNFLQGTVLYSGTRKVPFGPKKWAMPISSLWL